MDQVWNSGDLSNLSSYVAPSYEVRNDPGDPWNGQVLDHETFKERVAYTRNAFPDVLFGIWEMVEDGDTVAIHWTMSGTHTGDLPQLPATGKNFQITGMTFYYFEDGKICGHSQAFDQLGFLTQISQ